MSDIVEFLRARLDEDEQAARLVRKAWFVCDPDGCVEPEPFPGENLPNHHSNWREFYNPARVLADVAAKREFLAGFAATDARADVEEYSALSWVVRLLAYVYSDHEDYRQEWTP